jgi:hypothetical protein
VPSAILGHGGAAGGALVKHTVSQCNITLDTACLSPGKGVHRPRLGHGGAAGGALFGRALVEPDLGQYPIVTFQYS